MYPALDRFFPSLSSLRIDFDFITVTAGKYSLDPNFGTDQLFGNVMKHWPFSLEDGQIV